MRALRHRAIACCLALGLTIAIGGCGATPHPMDATADNIGQYVKLDGLYYQLQISRQLNQFGVEDRQYIAGVSAGQSGLAPGQLWFGVFLRAMNETKSPLKTTDSFNIVDTQGNKYYPVQIDPAVNPYVWTARVLEPQGTEPQENTTAFFAPPGGSLLLFKLNTSVFNNRPLTLIIHGTGTQPATISLDL